jgi:superfamily II DNA/RNA helicase
VRVSCARVLSCAVGSSHVQLTAPKPWLAHASNRLARQHVRFADEREKQPTLAALLTAASPTASPAAAAAAPPAAGGGAPLAAPGASPFAALTLVVVSTRRHCEMVLYFLQGEGFAVGSLAHDRPKRADKESTLSAFASGTKSVLIVTDAALRALGEELPPVGHVVSFDFPASMADCARATPPATPATPATPCTSPARPLHAVARPLRTRRTRYTSHALSG